MDGWEAAALVESLGYTDARVQREFGFPDTRAAGVSIYEASRQAAALPEPWSPPSRESRWRLVIRSAASTLIYAVPWLAVFVAQLLKADSMRMPATIAPALAVALMFSLIASGGFVQAIVRRGEFYVSLRQAAMARQVVAGIVWIGLAAALLMGALGVAVGWYFELFPWPSLILGADAFVIMSFLWMVCGAFGIRQQQWRVALAFASGFCAFAAVRTAGGDALTAQLCASAVVLAAAAVQARRVFGEQEGDGSLAGVARPKALVLAYWTAPYFLYGTIYFAFLFADRLSTGTATMALAGQQFGIPAQYTLGMELALLTLLVAASGVEVAASLFARAVTSEARFPLGANAQGLSGCLRRCHRRAVVLTVTTFGAAAALIAGLAAASLPTGLLTPRVWVTLAVGDVAYACLATGLLNALILFETRRPWTVVSTFAMALAINLAAGYLMSHALGGFQALNGLVAGSLYFAAASTAAVKAAWKDPAYAYAVA
jgi:hypothetical protein